MDRKVSRRRQGEAEARFAGVSDPERSLPQGVFGASDEALGDEGPVSAVGDKNTIATTLVGRLREAILRGEIPPGSKINLEKVRRGFSVSLSPMREALARLTAAGLVELHDNRGYSVAPVSLSNLKEITKLRAEFETFALAVAMQEGGLAWESDIIRALHRLNRIERVPSDPMTLEAWELAHRDFHLTLIQGCGMPILVNFCSSLHNLNDRYRRIFLVRTGGDRNVEQEHSQIAHATVARDVEFARARLREHILRTGLNLQEAIRPNLEGDKNEGRRKPRREGNALVKSSAAKLKSKR
ncbi:GntR family transcriptional regulator [Bradyrhizobium liaoningense]|nr:GntR family transcriptional regulator [Bradyrhizobium liaoningense]MBR0859128.1 GntR family transcriptional regulator [Bradyrhizobium liaoningense]